MTLRTPNCHTSRRSRARRDLRTGQGRYRARPRHLWRSLRPSPSLYAISSRVDKTRTRSI
jgi:hypothetical protein